MGFSRTPWLFVRRTLQLGNHSSAVDDASFEPDAGLRVPTPSADARDDESVSALGTRETLQAQSWVYRSRGA
jgi:hypothetical protein